MKYYDSEFGAPLLAALRERELLMKGNWVHAVPLHYAIATELAKLEEDFQGERLKNPLLEQTPPLTWLTARLVSRILEIRPNVRVGDNVLSQSVQKYLRRHLPRRKVTPELAPHELVKTMEPYLGAVRKLLTELFDRRRSLAGVLALRAKTYSLRPTLAFRKPKTLREQIFVRGIGDGWSNSKIAHELDRKHLIPRDKRWETYMAMNVQYPKQFQVLKSRVKSKYLVITKKS